jgi:hypothetical protein
MLMTNEYSDESSEKKDIIELVKVNNAVLIYKKAEEG